MRVREEPYILLGLPVDCQDSETIKKAFRDKAKMHHSDKGGSDEAMWNLIEARQYCEMQLQ